MSGTVIWSRVNNVKLTGYDSLCQFLQMLNTHEAPADSCSSLMPLFDTTINPVIASKIPHQNVKVLYPFGGADSVTAFLLPHVSEVVIIDYAYFYDRNTQLYTSAMETFENTPRDKKIFEGFSGMGSFDITDKQNGAETTIIEVNANTIYHNSSQQHCYSILMRLKTQLGAQFEELSFIDPEHKDLGFVVRFVDRSGNKRALKYFQRSNCTEQLILTMGRAEGSSALERTEAIKKEASTIDIVLFKAASGLAESAVVQPILQNIKSDVPIIFDGPYEKEDADLIKTIAKKEDIKQLQFVSSSVNNITRLGYNTFKEYVAMISNAKVYKYLISQVTSKKLYLKHIGRERVEDEDEDELSSLQNHYNLILKHILYGDEENAISKLQLTAKELGKIIEALAMDLHASDHLKLESRLKATVDKLFSNMTGAPLNYTELNMIMSTSSFTVCFLDIVLSNAKYIDFPSEQWEKESFVNKLFHVFYYDRILILNEEVKEVFLKTLAVCAEYMELSYQDMSVIFKTKFLEFNDDISTTNLGVYMEMLDRFRTPGDCECDWEISLLKNREESNSKKFIMKTSALIKCLKQQDNVADVALRLKEKVKVLTNIDHIKQVIQLPSLSYTDKQMIEQKVQLKLASNLRKIVEMSSQIKDAAMYNDAIKGNAIILLNAMRDGIQMSKKSTDIVPSRFVIEILIHNLGGQLSNEVDMSNAVKKKKNRF